MKLFIMIALTCLFTGAACHPTPPPTTHDMAEPAKCTPGFEEIKGWNLTVTDPASSIVVDPMCASKATMKIGSDTAVYIEKFVATTPGQVVTLQVVADLACDPTDGKLSAGIVENGDKVDFHIGTLASQTLIAKWTAKGSALGLVVGAQSKRPCNVGVRIALGK